MHTKEAFAWPEPMSNHDLLKLTLKSLLVGGGAYGAARLGKDMYNEFKGPQKPKNELNVPIPTKLADDNGNVTLPGAESPHVSPGKYIWPTLGAVGGGAAGFFGAAKLYDTVKNHFLEKDLKKKQQEYVDTLQQVNQKMGEHPNVDELIKGIISKIGELTLEKIAVTPGFGEMASKSLSRGLGYLGDKAHEATSALGDIVGKGFHGLTDKAKELYHGEFGAALKAGLMITALGSGAATYMIAKNMEKKKEEAARQSQLPTDLKLTPVSSSPNAIPGQLH